MRLTAREQEILDILRKEPLISQDELAERLAITRSSVAVHISNLMKKGIILGKGYVFNDKVTCVVVGDCMVMTDVRASDAQQVSVTTRMTGFGFDSSRSLAYYGLNVRLISLIGTDAESDRLQRALEQAGVDLTLIQRPSHGRCPHYVRIQDAQKENNYYQRFAADEFIRLIELRDWAILNCEWLLIQGNLLDAVMERFAPKMGSIFGSVALILRPEEWDALPENLSMVRLAVAYCENMAEADRIIRQYRPVARGVDQFVVTDGINAVVVETASEHYEIYVPPGHGFKIDTGVYDFASGVIHGIGAGYQLRQAIRIGLGAMSKTENES